MTCRICESLKEPSLKIYEDERIVAMLNDKPAAPGHIILTTKDHHPIFENVPDDIVAHIFSVANKLSTITFESLGAHGSNIIVNNGIAAGQKFPHFILHVIPRHDDDNIDFSWQPKKLSEQEFSEIQTKLTAPAEAPVEPAGAKQGDDKKSDAADKVVQGGDKDYLLDSLTRIP